MNWTFHPQALLLTGLFLAGFALVLARAIDLTQAAGAGVVALAAYLLVELLVTWNPAVWRRERRSSRSPATVDDHR